jgi:uncharacterized protein YecE (DUF72 family)
VLKTHIGTSGYNYSHWANGVFYPEGLTQNKWLEYYCQFFNSVELNVSFYRLVSKRVFENWYKRTPKDFSFVAKGSRFITHVKKLKDCREPLKIFLENSSGLKEKLSCILWQLPPGLKKDLKRLEDFLKILKDSAKNLKQAIEFRNKSWFDKETYDLLKRYNICLCIAHSDRWKCVKEITSDFLYLRFHGGEILYGSNYSDKELKDWADFALSTKIGEVFGFFNNDAYGYAVKNALKFKELLGK